MARKYFNDPNYNHIRLFLVFSLHSSCTYRQGFGYIVFEFEVLVPRKCQLKSDLFLLKQKLLKCTAGNIKLNNNV